MLGCVRGDRERYVRMGPHREGTSCSGWVPDLRTWGRILAQHLSSVTSQEPHVFRYCPHPFRPIPADDYRQQPGCANTHHAACAS